MVTSGPTLRRLAANFPPFECMLRSAYRSLTNVMSSTHRVILLYIPNSAVRLARVNEYHRCSDMHGPALIADDRCRKDADMRHRDAHDTTISGVIH